MAPHTPKYLGHRGWHLGALAAFKNCDPTPFIISGVSLPARVRCLACVGADESVLLGEATLWATADVDGVIYGGHCYEILQSR